MIMICIFTFCYLFIKLFLSSADHKQINPLGVVGQLTVTVQISRYSDAYSSYKVRVCYHAL